MAFLKAPLATLALHTALAVSACSSDDAPKRDAPAASATAAAKNGALQKRWKGFIEPLGKIKASFPKRGSLTKDEPCPDDEIEKLVKGGASPDVRLLLSGTFGKAVGPKRDPNRIRGGGSGPMSDWILFDVLQRDESDIEHDTLSESFDEALAKAEKVRFIGIFDSEDYTMPKGTDEGVRTGNGIATKFTPGSVKGRLILFDRVTAEQLCHFAVSAKSSDNIKAMPSKRLPLIEDLDKNTRKAAADKLAEASKILKIPSSWSR